MVKKQKKKMIIPHPDSDLTLNTMILGSNILEILQLNKCHMNVDSLMREFIKADIKRTPELFIDAVIFLYSINIIKYQSYNITIKQC